MKVRQVSSETVRRLDELLDEAEQLSGESGFTLVSHLIETTRESLRYEYAEYETLIEQQNSQLSRSVANDS